MNMIDQQLHDIHRCLCVCKTVKKTVGKDIFTNKGEEMD